MRQEVVSPQDVVTQQTKAVIRGLRLWRTAWVLTFVFFVIARRAFAADADPFGGAELMQQATHARNFLFGPVMWIAGSASALWGVVRALFGSSFKPVVMYIAIGVCTGLMPTFIDAVFGTG